MKRLLLLLSLIFSACAPDPTETDRKFDQLNLQIQFDPVIDRDQETLVKRDYLFLESLEFGPVQNEFFTQIFGGPGRDDVKRYLDTRINYFVPQLDSIGARVRIQADEIVLPGLMAPGSHEGGGEPTIVATNLGTLLWLNDVAQEGELRFAFGNELLDIDSTRIGIVMLGEGYVDPNFKNIMRVGTQVHEARHSDCTGGIAAADIERLRNNETPTSLSCGHLHVSCPEGHEFEGVDACDGHAWGAYSVGAVFFSNLAGDCGSCSEEQLQLALISAADAQSRVLVLEEMLAGELGEPDMTSSSVVVE